MPLSNYTDGDTLSTTKRSRLPSKHQLSPQIEKIVKNIEGETKNKYGRTVHRTYQLNDVNSLRKKLKCETARKTEFAIEKEARNGSNVKIEMKTSFFEFAKARLIQDLQANVDIVSIENGEAVKAATELNGDAYVEFSLEISFKASNYNHRIKLTAY